jgi:hypothetical protein
MSRVYPQLRREDAVNELHELEAFIGVGKAPSPLLDGFHSKTIFPGFGGVPVTIARLRELHDTLESDLEAVRGKGRDADRQFDVIVGRRLAEWFETDGRNQASDPEIWPYLSILVLPDLALRRFGPDGSGRLPRDRYLSGRRNVFYRAYLRSWILGDLLADPDLPLYEDDLVGLVDRNLSADHRIARIVAQEIRAVPAGEHRRERVRTGLKGLQYELRVSDLASLEDQIIRGIIRGLFE